MDQNHNFEYNSYTIDKIDAFFIDTKERMSLKVWKFLPLGGKVGGSEQNHPHWTGTGPLQRFISENIVIRLS